MYMEFKKNRYDFFNLITLPISYSINLTFFTAYIETVFYF